MKVVSKGEANWGRRGKDQGLRVVEECILKVGASVAKVAENFKGLKCCDKTAGYGFHQCLCSDATMIF